MFRKIRSAYLRSFNEHAYTLKTLFSPLATESDSIIVSMH